MCFVGFIKSVHVVEFTISVAGFIIQILNDVGGLVFTRIQLSTVSCIHGHEP